MKIAVVAATPKAKTLDTVVRFISRDDPRTAYPTVSELEFSAHLGAQLYLRHERLLLVGVGERAKIGTETLRRAAGVAATALRKIGILHFGVDLHGWSEQAGAIVEGVLLASYRFEKFVTKPRLKLLSMDLRVSDGQVKEVRVAAQHAAIVAEAVNECREIGNQPGNLLDPETLAAHAVKLARETKLKATVFDEAALQKRGFGGLLAVGRGSSRGPRFIVLEHRGGAKSDPVIALVGKAITFDTGGISIKPAANMEEMIFDKCGGMAVLGAMAAIARLGLKRNVVGLIASAENMPGGDAYRPGDIVTTYDGRHIEIINTDAEGRVVLADAIAYARRDCKAAAIVDLATLTGACVVALGETAAGLFGNDEALIGKVRAAADRAGERVWHLPIFPEHEDQIKSEVALIKNTGGRQGGACTAAAFLKTFAEDTPWVHLDIAPVAHREKDRPDLARGATGYGVRTLVELVENWNG